MLIPGKFALVTGAARGIGRAIAIALLKKGAAGVCLIDRDQAQLAQTTEELKAMFHQSLVCSFAADVTEKDQLERAFSFAKEHFGKLQIVANNAGVLNEDDPELVAAVNLVAPYRGTLLALQHMGLDKPGGEGGVIINTASLAGLINVPQSFFYAATKHGVVALTRSVGNAGCLSRTGVRINCLCPSFTDTDMIRSISSNTTFSSDALKMWNDLQSKMLRPETVADAFLKLVDDDSANGKALAIISAENIAYHEFPVEKYDFS